MKENINGICGECKYGITKDMSIDDLTTHCFISHIDNDWCDMKWDINQNLKTTHCPLNNASQIQKDKAIQEIKQIKDNQKMFYRSMNGRTKLIRKRNISRVMKQINNNQINV